VTEALNRLARAYSCLTDPAARQAYDQSLRAPAYSEPGLAQATPENGLDQNDPLAWLFGPWNRMAGPESATAASGRQPHFQDWRVSKPPPRQRKRSPVIDAREEEPAIPSAPSPPTESGLTSSSWLWKHSGVFLVVLSLLALMAAVWRQLHP